MRVSEWTSGRRAAPEPLEGNVVAAILIGTLVWAVLFVAQLPFYAWFHDRGHAWWIWTCLVGVGLGLLGLGYVRRRAAARTRRTSPPGRPGDAGPPDGPTDATAS